MAVLGIVFLVIIVLAVIAAFITLVRSLPDLRRYKRIRDM